MFLSVGNVPDELVTGTGHLAISTVREFGGLESVECEMARRDGRWCPRAYGNVDSYLSGTVSKRDGLPSSGIAAVRY